MIRYQSEIRTNSDISDQFRREKKTRWNRFGMANERSNLAPLATARSETRVERTTLTRTGAVGEEVAVSWRACTRHPKSTAARCMIGRAELKLLSDGLSRCRARGACVLRICVTFPSLPLHSRQEVLEPQVSYLRMPLPAVFCRHCGSDDLVHHQYMPASSVVSPGLLRVAHRASILTHLISRLSTAWFEKSTDRYTRWLNDVTLASLPAL